MIHQKLFTRILNYSLDVNKNGIYSITHLDKPGLRYIGSAFRKFDFRVPNRNGMYKRWGEHVSLLSKGRHPSKRLQRTVNKYGLENLRFEVIEVIETNREAVLEREEYWISYFDSCKNGFNGTPKATGGYFSEEERLFSSMRMKESNPMFSEESKRKGVESRRYKTDANRRPLLQYTKNGEFVQEWKYAKDASLALGVDSTLINVTAHGKQKACANFIWLFKDCFSEEALLEKVKLCQVGKRTTEAVNQRRVKTRWKKVDQLDIEGNFIATFDSVKEASLKTGVDRGNISSVCTGNADTAKGFKWRHRIE